MSESEAKSTLTSTRITEANQAKIKAALLQEGTSVAPRSRPKGVAAPVSSANLGLSGPPLQPRSLTPSNLISDCNQR